MRDAQYPLRMAIFGVLTGNLTYNGAMVNLYDEKKKAGQADSVYILFGTQQSITDHTSEYWMTKETIDLEITHKSGFEATKDFIDALSNQIYELLMPTRMNDSLPDPSLMQIQLFELERAITRNIEITPTQTILSKFLTFSCTIVQQTP